MPSTSALPSITRTIGADLRLGHVLGGEAGGDEARATTATNAAAPAATVTGTRKRRQCSQAASAAMAALAARMIIAVCGLCRCSARRSP